MMCGIKIPAAEVEFHEGGNTIWVHSPIGATILRIKTRGRITVRKCDMNPVSHADVYVEDGIEICLAADAVVEEC